MASDCIHVMGASGTGATTLGRELGRRLAVPVVDVDDVYWYPDPPYEAKRPVEERLALVDAALAGHSSWVVSGSLAGWGDPIAERFTLIVFLVVPTVVRLERLRRRETERFGAEALAPGGHFAKNHREFLAWAAAYDDGEPPMRCRRRHESWLARQRCLVLRLDGERPIEELVDEVTAVIGW